ncbi:hypothetical protein SHXM_06290 [Streptomyces hygroscopicus]|nr:hypothetical protein SHXM_06290 [Streptomyces hygroscopicus]
MVARLDPLGSDDADSSLPRANPNTLSKPGLLVEPLRRGAKGDA